MKVIRNLSLKLSPGRVTAVVGDSGAGKSTLTHLLLRLYDPSQGGIFVDDFNLKELDLATYHRFRLNFFANFAALSPSPGLLPWSTRTLCSSTPLSEKTSPTERQRRKFLKKVTSTI